MKDGIYKIGHWNNGKRTKWLTQNEIDEFKDNEKIQKILKEN